MDFAVTVFIGALAAIIIATVATIASSIAGDSAAERQQRAFNDDRVVAEVRIRTTTTVAWIWATVSTALLGGGVLLYRLEAIVMKLCN